MAEFSEKLYVTELGTFQGQFKLFKNKMLESIKLSMERVEVVASDTAEILELLQEDYTSNISEKETIR